MVHKVTAICALLADATKLSSKSSSSVGKTH